MALLCVSVSRNPLKDRIGGETHEGFKAVSVCVCVCVCVAGGGGVIQAYVDYKDLSTC